MWSFLVRHILRDRVAFLIGIGLLTIFMGYQAKDVKMLYEMASILPAKDSTIIIYENFKKQFGEDGSILFIGIQDKNLYRLKEFNDWFDLSLKLKNIKGIEEVLSVTRLYRLVKNDSIKKFVFSPISPLKPKNQHELDSIRNIIFSFPLYDNLIFNKETGATIMMVTVDKNKMNDASRVQFIENIKQVADSFGLQYNIPVHYSGLPYIRTVTAKKIQHELKLFVLLALAVAAIFLFIFFRSFKAVLFPMIIVVISVIWALGMMALFGYKITVLTGDYPPFINRDRG